jgi:hypothetical protein
MIVIATDERGDDAQMVDTVASLCAKMGTRVFCLGKASPFGVERGFVRWTYSDGFEQDIPVDSGPETITSQVLNTPWLGGPRLNLSRVSSGFGPYALCKLCQETGGRFLIAEDPAVTRFAADIMEKYGPGYFGSQKEFERSLKSNAAKLAVVKAAMQARQHSLRPLTLKLRADSHNAIRTYATEPQKILAVILHYSDELIQILETGLEDRPLVKEPR